MVVIRGALIYAGIGIRGSGQDVVDLSRKIKAPVAVTGINFDEFDANFEALLGSANRVATKPANEAFPNAETVVFVGNNYPFAEVTNLFENVKNFIQIDINPANLGKRNYNDVTILGDVGEAIRELTKLTKEKPETGWWRANLANIKNWNDYVHKLETKTETFPRFLLTLCLVYYNLSNARPRHRSSVQATDYQRCFQQ